MINYTYMLTVPAGTLAAEPEEQEVKLTTGQLKRVSIGFPYGCRGTVHVNVLLSTLQIIPFIDGQSYNWDNIMQPFDVNFKIDDTSPPIVLRGWSPNARYEHNILFVFSVETEQEQTMISSFLRTIVGGS